jgi:hypothetical protein
VKHQIPARKDITNQNKQEKDKTTEAGGPYKKHQHIVIR